MAEDEQETPEALKLRLEEFRSSLEEITEGLKLDPSNDELLKLRKDVLEVIAFTEGRLRGLSQSTGADRTPPAAAGASAAPAVAKTVVSEGDKVFAIFSGDGLWYEGVIKQVHASGNVTVLYSGYGNSEERDLGQLRKADGTVTLDELNAQLKAGADTKKRTSAAWELPSKDPKKQAKCATLSCSRAYCLSFQGAGQAEEGGSGGAVVEAVCEQGVEDEGGHGRPEAQGVDLPLAGGSHGQGGRHWLWCGSPIVCGV